MSKKTSKPIKESDIQRGWVFSPTTSGVEKLRIAKQFEPVIEALREKITPIPEPHTANHCTEIFGQWNRNFFYIMQTIKIAGDKANESIETGLARLEFYGDDRFHLAHSAEAEQWITVHKDVSFEEVKKALLEEPMFSVN
jgi:hypothetical protein